jgi:hypothetical protein
LNASSLAIAERAMQREIDARDRDRRFLHESRAILAIVNVDRSRVNDNADTKDELHFRPFASSLFRDISHPPPPPR